MSPSMSGGSLATAPRTFVGTIVFTTVRRGASSGFSGPFAVATVLCASPPYRSWSRYLGSFGSARVAARVETSEGSLDDLARADGPGVSFCALPHYIGPAGFLQVRHEIRLRLAAAFEWGDAVIVRAYSPLSTQLFQTLRRDGYPYALEVVSDPHDAFAPGAVRHPLRWAFRWWFARSLRRQCAEACAVAYVTRESLQRRYPAAAASFTTHYSSIDLEEGHFVAAPRPVSPRPEAPRLIFVGSLAQMYKGPDILLDALAACRRQGLDLRLTIVGDGRHRLELERRAAALDLSDRVRFTGEVRAGDAVRQLLDAADLFVLPSRTEGLPRAMIEAMARGLPCIGTSVGGIPELLETDDLVPPGAVGVLAQRIASVLSDPERLARMSARNLLRSREFADSELQQRRNRFYEEVRRRTESWLARRS